MSNIVHIICIIIILYLYVQQQKVRMHVMQVI